MGDHLLSRLLGNNFEIQFFGSAEDCDRTAYSDLGVGQQTVQVIDTCYGLAA